MPEELNNLQRKIFNIIDEYTIEKSSSKLVKKPLVSVCLITYNQIEYIQKAVDGVLRQLTDFPIEIVIGDDDSSDGTTQILLDLQLKHPNKIRLLCAAENLGVLSDSSFHPNLIRCLQACRGKYIALIEGDDCWLSPNKLQRQYDKMESFPDIGLCVHDAECLVVSSNTHVDWFPVRQDTEYTIPYKDVFTTPGQFAPTASYFIRQSMLFPLGKVFFNAPVADFFIEATAGVNGVIYLPERMSLYRRESSSSSWSSIELSDTDIEKFNWEMIASLQEFQGVMPRKFRSYVKYKIRDLLKKEYERNIIKKNVLGALKCRLTCLILLYDLKNEIIILASLFGIKVAALVKIKNVFRRRA
jgi:glycosyltransferase involved in cell wall biosynthesis